MTVATLNGSSVRLVISRGCAQGGVLSPLLRCLVVNALLARLGGSGIFIQGYEDGKFTNTVSGLMQWVHSTVEIRCSEIRVG